MIKSLKDKGKTRVSDWLEGKIEGTSNLGNR